MTPSRESGVDGQPEEAAGAERRDGRGRWTRRRLLAGSGLGAVVGLAGCVIGDGDRRTATESFAVDGDDVDRVVVRGDDGDTVVRGTDEADVRVEATTYAVGGTDLEDVTVTREVTDGRLTIGVEVPGGISLGPSGGGLAALTVRVPRSIRVRRVAVDDGTARVRDVRGDLAVSLDDGSADVDGVDGALEVDVDDGDVTVGRVTRLRGDVDDGGLRMTRGARVGDLATDDGRLELAVAALDGEPTVRLDDGTLEAALAADLDATVEIHADDGSLDVDDGLFDSYHSDDGVTTGRMGDGSGRLTVRVDDGDVRLRPLDADEADA